MRIKRVEGQNIKGRSFKYDLDAAVAICGDNFSGKTSVIDAIRLPLIGYIPELGKTNSATMQLASGEVMMAAVTFDYPESVVSVSGFWEKATAKVNRLGFNEALQSIPLLNAAAYFQMTERERYDYVFQIARIPEDFTIDSIIAECERLTFGDAHSEQIEKAKRQVIEELRLYQPQKLTIQEYLVNRVERMKHWYSTWNARQKDTVGAVRVMAELKNRSEAKAGNAREAAKAYADAKEAVAQTFDKHQALQKLRGDKLRLDERKARFIELEKAAGPTADQQVKSIQTRIEEAIGKLKPNVPEAKSEFELLQLRDKFNLASNVVTLERKQLESLREQLKEIDAMEHCPYCGATDKNWKATLRNKVTADIDSLQNSVEHNEGELTKAKQELDSAEAEAKTVREILAHNREWNQKILQWNQQIDELQKKQGPWLEQVEKERKALAAITVEEVTDAELAEAGQKYTEAVQHRNKAETEMREAELLQHELARAAQAEIAHLQAKALVTVIKSVGEVLQQKRADLVDSVFGDLLACANTIAGAILPSALAFHEGEVGRWEGHRWISHKTMSGTEQALTFVAIAMALSQQSPLRLLIFDEMGRLDDLRQHLLINTLQDALTRGDLDQYILAGATMPETLPGAIQVIDLTPRHALD